MHHLSIKKLVEGLRNKKFSSTELTQHYLDRIKQHNPKINAYISISESTALEQASKADKQIAKQSENALTGVPITLKDIYCVDGGKTTCGSKMLENFIAPYDATVTSKVKENYMPILGKANMDEFAMGSTTRTSYFNNTLNPWDETAIPGGSSGGPASSVAARLTPLAVGTDTGGSIRQPAACCGITGLKPTYGTVSRWGQIAFASSLDQGGPMAASAEDCAFLLDVISGRDEKDSTSIKQSATQTVKTINDSPDSKTIGVPYHLFEDDSDYTHLNNAIAEFKKLGYRIKPIQMDYANLAIAAYYVIASAEASSNLSRYDGVRYGYRCENPINLEDLYKRSRTEGFGDEVKNRLMIGTYVLSSGYYDAYYLQAQKVRRIITNELKQLLKEYKFIIMPTKSGVAFDIDSQQDPVSIYMEDMFTTPVNLAGLPGISVPIGFNEKNRPYGMQIIGDYLDEGSILQAAHQYQKVTNWHTKTPLNYK